MVNKAITQIDLQNLEIRLKLEIREQEKKDRHNLDNKLWAYFFKVDALEKTSAVNDNILKNMSYNFQEMKDAFDKLSNKIEWLDEKYWGKWTEKVLAWLWATIWIAFIGALMTLILK